MDGKNLQPATCPRQTIENLAFRNLRRAKEIIADTGIEAIWRSVGVEPRLVGSVKTGLLVKHLDIDFHV